MKKRHMGKQEMELSGENKPEEILTKEELGKLYPVKLEPYNEKWPILFNREMAHLKNLFGIELRIEHIGSTAVKGLSAKPTIDILMELPVALSKTDIIKKMEENSYIFMKEQTEHLMFVKGYTSTGLAEESFHVHMGPLSLSWLWDRIFFRDYLIENPEEAGNYEKLKMNLALKYENDREAYTDGKGEYIKMVTERAKSKLHQPDLSRLD